MPATLQRSLELTGGSLHRRTALVTVDTVRAILGVDADTVYERIEDGRIRWAWDISASGRMREMRIWARELIVGQEALPVEVVIDSLIDTHRPTLRSVEVSQLLLCSRPHMLSLLAAGALQGPRAGHTQHITRESLAAFLRRRLAGDHTS